MPHKYALLLSNYGVPIHTQTAQDGPTVQGRVSLDFRRLVFALLLAAATGIFTFVISQAHDNGAMNTTIDSLKTAIDMNSKLTMKLQTALVRNTTVIQGMKPIIEIVHQLKTEIAVLKANEKHEGDRGNGH